MKHAMIKAAFAALRNAIDLLEKALLAGVPEDLQPATRDGDPPPEDPGRPGRG